MTRIQTQTARAAAWTVTIATTVLISACQTVDLGEPEMAVKNDAVPSCEVTPGDYKILAYLQQGKDVAKSTRITDVLKKKYATATPVNGANPIVAVKSFVAAKADMSPMEIEAMATRFCTR